MRPNWRNVVEEKMLGRLAGWWERDVRERRIMMGDAKEKEGCEAPPQGASMSAPEEDMSEQEKGAAP